MLAVILINALLIAFVLVAIVGSHVWAVLSARERRPQPAAMSPLRARARRRRQHAASIGRGVTATP